MYQAITTKYIGPSNFRESRIKATATAGSLTVPWEDALSVSDNHRVAAIGLAEKYGWHGQWHGGGMADESGYTFVLATGDKRDGFTIPKREAAVA